MTIDDDLTFVVVWEDTGPVVMARVHGSDDTPIVQADVDSISVSSWVVQPAANEGDQNGSTDNPTVADVIFDTLQTSDTRWTIDTTGYNVKYEMLASQLPVGSSSAGEPRIVQLEIIITPTGGGPNLPVVVQFEVRGLYSS